MSYSQTIRAVIQQFRTIFADGGEMKGYDAWNNFFGCIQQLEYIANDFEQLERAQQEQAKGAVPAVEVYDGESVAE